SGRKTMNGSEVLRIVDAIHRDKNIDKEIVFEGIEQAIVSAARKHFGEESQIDVHIDRDSGEPAAAVNGQSLEKDEIGDLLGRIAAQTAKQVIIQKIREAERDALYDEYEALRGNIVTGTITRLEGGTATVNLGKVEGLLPRGEQIPGESHRVGERVRAVVIDVRKAGSRVRIILSRTHPEMVRRLFEIEIPEVQERIIEVRSLAREAGYRSKVAVSCYDSKIDCVGACVGVRGSRIKNVVEELAGERIDIVRWNDSLQVLVPNALQPAEVEEVILCPMLGKVIVLVQDDQLSLAIGKKGQNVRLASKLVGWDIHVMNQKKLDEQLNKSVGMFSQIPGVSEELAENLVEQGFFTFDDLSVIEPDQLAELGGLTPEQCEIIVAHADRESARIEEEERRAIAEGRLRPPEPVVAETSVAPAETVAEPALESATAGEESHDATGGVEDASAPQADEEAAGSNGAQSELDAAHTEESHESTTGQSLAEDATTIESPLDEPGATEHAVEVTQGRNVEQEAAKVPQRANGEQSPSLETAALDDQAEE
ncbi:MAG TPA: transcription termination factor NusA, partial [Planctomycetaceae bacterium]|nr:transcription termination factor NusA [Planctomycetaceae bacterium]